MNKSMLAGIGIGVAAALGVAAVASLNVFERARNTLRLFLQPQSRKRLKHRVRSVATSQ